MHHFGNHIGHFGYLVATELAPLHIEGRIFLLAGVITVLLLEQPEHFRMVTVIPRSIFTVLHNAIMGPQGGGKHHIHKTMIVDGNAIQAFHFAVGLDFFLDELADFGQCRAEKLVIAYIGGSVCQALAVTIHAEPFGMLLQYLVTVVFQIHGP